MTVLELRRDRKEYYVLLRGSPRALSPCQPYNVGGRRRLLSIRFGAHGFNDTPGFSVPKLVLH